MSPGAINCSHRCWLSNSALGVVSFRLLCSFALRGMGKSVESMALEFLSPLHQSFPYPGGIPAAIKNGKNDNSVVDDAVVDGKWEPFRKLTMVSEHPSVNSGKERQRINVGIERIKKIRSETGTSRLIESVSSSRSDSAALRILILMRCCS